jgi:putative transposase
MKRKKHSAEQVITKLRKADELLGEGKSPEEVAKALGVTVTTYYRWRRQYGEVGSSEAKRLRELEKENAKLKKLVAEQALDNLILKEVIEGKI